MHFARIWLFAARPKTLIAVLSPISIGTTLALKSGFFHPLVFLFTLLTAVGIQVLTNYANDYFDYIKGADTSERKGPLRVMQARLVSERAMKQAIALVGALTFLIGCTLISFGGVIIALLLLLSLLLALLYTAGPYPLAYLGLGDLFVWMFFGPVAVLGTYYLQTLHFSLEALLAGISPGCFSAAILIANNIRDIQEDRAAHKKTLAVRFGKTFGKIEYVSVLIAAWIPILFFTPHHPLIFLTLLVLIPAIPLMRAMIDEKEDNPKVLNALFFNTAKLLWIFTFLFCLGWML